MIRHRELFVIVRLAAVMPVVSESSSLIARHSFVSIIGSLLMLVSLSVPSWAENSTHALQWTGSPIDLLHRAVEAENDGDSAVALSCYDSIVAGPDTRDLRRVSVAIAIAYFRRGMWQHRYGQDDSALADFKSICERFPASGIAVRAALLRGAILIARGDTSAAFQTFEAVLTHQLGGADSSACAAALLGQADCLGYALAAQTILQQIIQDYPISPEAKIARRRLAVETR